MDETLPKEAIEALERNRLIEAIKITRTVTGMGLKESKEAVESYVLRNPALKAQLDAASVSVQLTREHMVLLVVALTMLFIYLVFVG
jgi:hypothetical protein